MGLAIDGATLTLVNTDAVHAAEVVIQGGVFGEHDFTSVQLGDATPVAASGRWLTVQLAAGATARLTLGMQRFAQCAELRHAVGAGGGWSGADRRA